MNASVDALLRASQSTCCIVRRSIMENRTVSLPVVLMLASAALAGCQSTYSFPRGVYTQIGTHAHPVAGPPPRPTSFTWPTEWKRETTALRHPFVGVEEAHVDPNDPTRFAFVWFIEDGPRLDRATVEAALKERLGDDASRVKTKTGACGARHPFLLVTTVDEATRTFQCTM